MISLFRFLLKKLARGPPLRCLVWGLVFCRMLFQILLCWFRFSLIFLNVWAWHSFYREVTVRSGRCDGYHHIFTLLFFPKKKSQTKNKTSCSDCASLVGNMGIALCSFFFFFFFFWPFPFSHPMTSGSTIYLSVVWLEIRVAGAREKTCRNEWLRDSGQRDKSSGSIQIKEDFQVRGNCTHQGSGFLFSFFGWETFYFLLFLS